MSRDLRVSLPQAASRWDDAHDLACSAARRVENLVDFSDVSWVHPGVLGDRSKPSSPEHEVRDDGVTISRDIALVEPRASVKGDVALGENVQREPTTYTLHLPLSVTLDQHLPPSTDRADGHHSVLFLAGAPLTTPADEVTGPQAAGPFVFSNSGAGPHVPRVMPIGAIRAGFGVTAAAPSGPVGRRRVPRLPPGGIPPSGFVWRRRASSAGS